MMFHRKSAHIIPFFFFLTVLLSLVFLVGCANFRAYYNPYFNGSKAFQKAERLKEARLSENPLDTATVSVEERKQLNRAIEKGSKVLELYGDNSNKYIPKSLYMIAESYFRLGDCKKAIRKYNELERNFPNFEYRDRVRFHRAQCLAEVASYSVAKKALEKSIQEEVNPDFQQASIERYAELEAKNDSVEHALQLYQRLLNASDISTKKKAYIAYKSARLSFAHNKWEQALQKSTMPEISELSVPLQYEMLKIQVQCLYHLRGIQAAVETLESLYKNNLFSKWEAASSLLLGKWYLEQSQNMKVSIRQKKQYSKKAQEYLVLVNEIKPKSLEAAEALYILGKQYLLRNREEEALKQFTLSASAGDTLEYAKKSRIKKEGILKIRRHREQQEAVSSKAQTHFLIAETFFLSLGLLDSALQYFSYIREDSIYVPKALYSQAFILQNSKNKTNQASKVYKELISTYPRSVYAKQAEKNLGYENTIRTYEDEAQELFLKAEGRLFSGVHLAEVIPMYQLIVDRYAGTTISSKALFVVGMLREQQYLETGNENYMYQARVAYQYLRKKYTTSPYFSVVDEKMSRIGIKIGDEVSRKISLDQNMEDVTTESSGGMYHEEYQNENQGYVEEDDSEESLEYEEIPEAMDPKYNSYEEEY
jgi:TolA-binding protein